MDGSIDYSDNHDCPPKGPLQKVLEEISLKLEGIERLEKKLTEVTSNFTEELDLIKVKLANLMEARNKDSEEINGLQSLFKEFSNDLHSTKANQEDLQMKLVKLDNTTNKNSERIEKLE